MDKAHHECPPAGDSGGTSVSPLEDPSRSDPENERVRRRRQRRLQKLEQATMKKERAKSSQDHPPRVFSLPGRLKTTSLFIRIGSMDSDSDPVPLEHYQYNAEGSNGVIVEEEEAANPDQLCPHPEALRTVKLFHLDELTTDLPIHSENNSSKNKPDINRRPHSMVLPLPSALKKPDSVKKKGRPRSLRFLDPKDQKLYMAISHGTLSDEANEDIANVFSTPFQRPSLSRHQSDGSPSSCA